MLISIHSVILNNVTCVKKKNIEFHINMYYYLNTEMDFKIIIHSQISLTSSDKMQIYIISYSWS